VLDRGLRALGVRQTALGPQGFAVGSFRAYLSSAFTVPNLGAAIPFDAEDWDVSGWHDSVTDQGKYTPKLRGIYRVSACVRFNDSLGDQHSAAVQIYKNVGLEATLGNHNTSGAESNFTREGTLLVKMNGSSDYLRCFIYQDTGSSKELFYGRTHTFWCAEFVGRL
jgi:hypothetical protein